MNGQTDRHVHLGRADHERKAIHSLRRKTRHFFDTTVSLTDIHISQIDQKSQLPILCGIAASRLSKIGWKDVLELSFTFISCHFFSCWRWLKIASSVCSWTWFHHYLWASFVLVALYMYRKTSNKPPGGLCFRAFVIVFMPESGKGARKIWLHVHTPKTKKASLWSSMQKY